MSQITEEEKKIAFQKVANVNMYLIFQLSEIINIATSRGAFKAPELSAVGASYDALVDAINKSVNLAREEIKAKEKESQESEKTTTEISLKE
jgi:hypothetical protein